MFYELQLLNLQSNLAPKKNSNEFTENLIGKSTIFEPNIRTALGNPKRFPIYLCSIVINYNATCGEAKLEQGVIHLCLQPVSAPPFPNVKNMPSMSDPGTLQYLLGGGKIPNKCRYVITKCRHNREL